MAEKEPLTPTTRKDVKGVIGTVIVLFVMVLAMIILVIANPRTPIINQISQTQTALQQEALLTSTAIPSDETEIASTPVNPVVNVNGIVIVGGALVLIVLGAVLREALLFKKDT